MSSAEAEAAADPDLFLRTYYDLDFRSYAAARGPGTILELRPAGDLYLVESLGTPLWRPWSGR